MGNTQSQLQQERLDAIFYVVILKKKKEKKVKVIFEQRYHYEKLPRANLLRGPG